MDDDTVIELTPEEWHAGAQRALNDLGLTYAELEGQARRRDFTSAQAHSLWTSIGGTIRPELLPDTKGRPSTAAGPQPRTENTMSNHTEHRPVGFEPAPTEPCVVTSPNDPCSVNVSVDDEDGIVLLTFNFHDRPTVEVTLDDHRADYIGDLLKKAVAMVEERNAAEMAAHVTAWRPPCPLHDGPSIEGTHCTCDGITDAYGNPIENDA